MSLEQLRLGLVDEEVKTEKVNTASTFADNLSLPVHRWFRYSAGFSATWVHELIEKEKENKEVRVLDPFSGSGEDAIEFVENYNEETNKVQNFIRYEIQVVFTDGTIIEGKFPYREKAVAFLRTYQQPLQKSIEQINQPRLDAL